jgi:regulator of sigma D
MLKDKDKHVEELLDSTKTMSNPAEDKQIINKLKAKLKRILEENDMLRKKELEKHEKLVKAERKVVELEQEGELPIGKEESLIKEIEEWKKKHKETMQRVERQNIYISKLNEKLTKETNQKSRKSGLS